MIERPITVQPGSRLSLVVAFHSHGGVPILICCIALPCCGLQCHQQQHKPARQTIGPHTCANVSFNTAGRLSLRQEGGLAMGSHGSAAILSIISHDEAQRPSQPSRGQSESSKSASISSSSELSSLFSPATLPPAEAVSTVLTIIWDSARVRPCSPPWRRSARAAGRAMARAQPAMARTAHPALVLGGGASAAGQAHGRIVRVKAAKAGRAAIIRALCAAPSTACVVTGEATLLKATEGAPAASSVASAVASTAVSTVASPATAASSARIVEASGIPKAHAVAAATAKVTLRLGWKQLRA
mmetsp:Transcript_54488/g.108180  ORF Transcript_54488/g.108180 Transcript_54488/m.108180 type:complete len:300 (+) Transcript_54488:215-1114(+)